MFFLLFYHFPIMYRATGVYGGGELSPSHDRNAIILSRQCFRGVIALRLHCESIAIAEGVRRHVGRVVVRCSLSSK